MIYKRFALEFDDPEITGSFAPLQHLPAGKVVVVGLITMRDSQLERLEATEAKVHEAAEGIAKAQGRTREEVIKDSISTLR